MSNSLATNLVAHVPLPELSDELLRRRCSSATWNDGRRFPRVKADDKCLLKPVFTYAVRESQMGTQDVWLRDLARGGVRFIHGAQMYPGERYSLTLAACVEVHVEVVWCRRIAPGAFIAGCLFVAMGDRSENS